MGKYKHYMETKKKGRKPLNLKAFEKIQTELRKVGPKKIVILKREWKLVTPPGAHILRKYLKHEYVVESLLTGKGWVIKRVR